MNEFRTLMREHLESTLCLALLESSSAANYVIPLGFVPLLDVREKSPFAEWLSETWQSRCEQLRAQRKRSSCRVSLADSYEIKHWLHRMTELNATLALGSTATAPYEEPFFLRQLARGRQTVVLASPDGFNSSSSSSDGAGSNAVQLSDIARKCAAFLQSEARVARVCVLRDGFQKLLATHEHFSRPRLGVRTRSSGVAATPRASYITGCRAYCRARVLDPLVWQRCCPAFCT